MINDSEMERLQKLSRYEQELHQAGVRYICGLDEVGRGPVAGPVVAAAVILPEGFLPAGADDSKKLTEKKRTYLEKEIKRNALAWSISIISPAILDDINIYQATKRAMIMAVESLSIAPEHLMIDAMRLPTLDIPQTPLIKGDSLSISIACASILAKVERDRLMDGMHELYPAYGFGKHKGYLTRVHSEALAQFGPCPIHRKSFEPIKSYFGGEKIADQCGLFDEGFA